MARRYKKCGSAVNLTETGEIAKMKQFSRVKYVIAAAARLRKVRASQGRMPDNVRRG